MKKLSTILCVVWLLVIVPSSFSNNISVSNVSLEGQVVIDHYCLVEFDLAWDNSWRTTSVPQNWDAAWVFVKYSVAGGPWFHAKIDPAGSVQPAGCTMDFADPSGVFIYRDADGSGTFSVTDIGIRWSYGDQGVNDDASVEVKVFAVEMVYVPQGVFYLGDGSSQYRMFEQPTNTNPFYIDGNTITLGISNGNLWATGAVGPASIWGSVPATFPTGYLAYYCMKYEISQEQYVDFLNTLTRDQQNVRVQVDVSGDAPTEEFVMSNLPWVYGRNGVTVPFSGNGTTDPITFYCNLNDNGSGDEDDDGQNVPCTYMSYMDLAAYADWACLRPITEPEYEKACRGPNTPVGGEKAWGNASMHASTYTPININYPNEIIGDPGTNIGNLMAATTNSVFQGPGRCGVFAASSLNHTRVETGATYYGIMEMTGNGLEMVVPFLSISGLSYTGLHGDGTLTTEGNGNVDYWPGMDGNNDNGIANVAYTSGAGITGYGGIGEKGGSWSQNTTNMAVSDRQYIHYTDRVGVNDFPNAPRLVRSAP